MKPNWTSVYLDWWPDYLKSPLGFQALARDDYTRASPNFHKSYPSSFSILLLWIVSPANANSYLCKIITLLVSSQFDFYMNVNHCYDNNHCFYIFTLTEKDHALCRQRKKHSKVRVRILHTTKIFDLVSAGRGANISRVPVSNAISSSASFNKHFLQQLKYMLIKKTQGLAPKDLS